MYGVTNFFYMSSRVFELWIIFLRPRGASLTLITKTEYRILGVIGLFTISLRFIVAFDHSSPQWRCATTTNRVHLQAVQFYHRQRKVLEVRLLQVNRRQRGTRLRLPKVNRRQRGTSTDSPKSIVSEESEVK